jgi:hypothetical protein
MMTFAFFFSPKKKPLSNLHWVFFCHDSAKIQPKKTNTGDDEEGLVVVFVILKEFWFVAKVTISSIRRCRKIDDDP